MNFKTHAKMAPDYPWILCNHGFAECPFITSDNSQVTCKKCLQILALERVAVETDTPRAIQHDCVWERSGCYKVCRHGTRWKLQHQSGICCHK